VVTGRRIFIGTGLALLLAAGAAAAPQARKPAPATAEPEAAKQLMESCDAHKFETVVKAVVDGVPRQSKVRLCGKEGQSDADWIVTLKDAIDKLNANKEMAPEVRGQIVTAIDKEIARLESGGTEQALAAPPPPRVKPQTSATLADSYSSLPPLPTTLPAPPHVIAPVAMGHVAKVSGSVPAVAAPIATGPAPKLTFACYAPGDLAGDAPCTGFQRETVLTVRAREDVRKGLELQFARNGEARATVDLAQLGRGKSMRIPLPADVCRGVGDGRLDLQIVDGGYVVASDGPYSLRC
jgi:hypothetical protein